MQKIPQVISEVCSGVVCLAFFTNGEQVGNGSGFLSNELLITNSHVIRPGPFDAVEITFGDDNLNPITPIRYLPEQFNHPSAPSIVSGTSHGAPYQIPCGTSL